MLEFKLKKILQTRGMTMSELSNRTGISRATLSSLSSGKTKGIQFSTLEKIAGALGLAQSNQLDRLIKIYPEYSDAKIIGISPLEVKRLASTFLIIFERTLYGKRVHDALVIELNLVPNEQDSEPSKDTWSIYASFSYLSSAKIWKSIEDTNFYANLKNSISDFFPNRDKYSEAIYKGEENAYKIINEIETIILPYLKLPNFIAKRHITKFVWYDHQAIFDLKDVTFKSLTGKNKDRFSEKYEQDFFAKHHNDYANLNYETSITTIKSELSIIKDIHLSKIAYSGESLQDNLSSFSSDSFIRINN